MNARSSPILRRLLMTLLPAWCLLPIAGCRPDADRADQGDGSAPRALELQLAYTIDGADADWGQIGTVVADDDGRVLVLDVVSSQALLFDSAGRFETSFGGRGEGPGEFRSVADAVLRDDEWIILDAAQRRISRFASDGTFVGSVSLPAEAGYPMSLLQAPDGVVLVGRIARPQEAPEPGGILRVRQPELRYTWLGTGDSLDGMFAVSDTSNVPRGFDCPAVGGAIAIFGTPLLGPAGPLRAALSGRTLARANTDSLSVELLDLGSGRAKGAIARSVQPQPLSDADWERVTDEFRERERVEGPFECSIDPLRPQSWPVVRSIASDEQDRLWVEVTVESNQRFDLMLFDGNGNLIARGAAPVRDARVPFHVRNDRVHVVTTDSLGLQSVEVYRVTLN